MTALGAFLGKAIDGPTAGERWCRDSAADQLDVRSRLDLNVSGAGARRGAAWWGINYDDTADVTDIRQVPAGGGMVGNVT